MNELSKYHLQLLGDIATALKEAGAKLPVWVLHEPTGVEVGFIQHEPDPPAVIPIIEPDDIGQPVRDEGAPEKPKRRSAS